MEQLTNVHQRMLESHFHVKILNQFEMRMWLWESNGCLCNRIVFAIASDRFKFSSISSSSDSIPQSIFGPKNFVCVWKESFWELICLPPLKELQSHKVKLKWNWSFDVRYSLFNYSLWLMLLLLFCYFGFVSYHKHNAGVLSCWLYISL